MSAPELSQRMSDSLNFPATPRRLTALLVGLALLAAAAGAHAQSARPAPIGAAPAMLGLDPGEYRLNDAIAPSPDDGGPRVLEPPEEIVLRIEQGETFADVLAAEDIAAAEITALQRALRSVVDARILAPGREFSLILRDTGAGEAIVLELHLIPAPNRLVTVTRDDAGGFTAQARDITIIRRPVRVAGVVLQDFDEAMHTNRVPTAAARQAARAFSYDVDFQRDVQRGHRFEFLYERLMTENGNTVGTGAVLFGALTLGRRTLYVYRHSGAKGQVEYVNARGETVRRAFLRTPVDRPRVTSRFGNRRHPILGYSRMHRGVDFGAPTGTRILAASDGVVDFVGWNRGYGRYVRIRHNANYQTAYAHLSSYASGMRAGARVRQGQVIGRVGSSGMSTGPHLHYEVHRNGAQINPLSVRQIGGRRLEGRGLAQFNAFKSGLHQQLAQLGGAPPPTTLAEAPPAAEPQRTQRPGARNGNGGSPRSTARAPRARQERSAQHNGNGRRAQAANTDRRDRRR